MVEQEGQVGQTSTPVPLQQQQKSFYMDKLTTEQIPVGSKRRYNTESSPRTKNSSTTPRRRRPRRRRRRRTLFLYGLFAVVGLVVWNISTSWFLLVAFNERNKSYFSTVGPLTTTHSHTRPEEWVPCGSTTTKSSQIPWDDTRRRGTDDLDHISTSAARATPGSFVGRRYAYVHIGKTGGSKLSCELGYRYAPTCANTKKNNETHRASTSQLMFHRGMFMHMHNLGDSSNYTTFLISIRNPVERLISWFQYEHPRQDWFQTYLTLGMIQPCSRQLHKWSWNNNASLSSEQHNHHTFDGCFASLEEFAGNITSPNNHRTTTCQDLAWNVTRGTIMCTYHNYYNYHWYTSRINQIAHKLAGKGNAHILVVNNNNMAKDWDTLEVLFGGNCTTSLPGSTIFRSKLNSVADGGRLAPAGQLSPRALHKLCVALCPEIQIYKKIILLAENMDNPQRRMSLEEVQR